MTTKEENNKEAKRIFNEIISKNESQDLNKQDKSEAINSQNGDVSIDYICKQKSKFIESIDENFNQSVKDENDNDRSMKTNTNIFDDSKEYKTKKKNKRLVD